MRDWDDEDNDNELNMVIWPPEKVDSLTNEKDVNDNIIEWEKSSKLPFDIAGLVEIDSKKCGRNERCTRHFLRKYSIAGVLFVEHLSVIRSKKFCKMQRKTPVLGSFF